MIEDEVPPYDNVSWSESGREFTIHNVTAFSNTLLPRYFKHANFSSFVRQLNSYVRRVDSPPPSPRPPPRAIDRGAVPGRRRARGRARRTRRRRPRPAPARGPRARAPPRASIDPLSCPFLNDLFLRSIFRTWRPRARRLTFPSHPFPSHRAVFPQVR